MSVKFEHLSSTKTHILILFAALGLSFNQLNAQCDPDVTPPVIQCGIPHFVGTCDGPYTLNSGSMNPQSYSDNCATQAELLLTNDYNNSNSLFGAVFPYGSHFVTWTVTETTGSQLSSTCIIQIVVTEFLTVDCPSSAVRNIGEACTYVVNGTEFDASGNNFCGPSTATNDYNNSNTLAGEELPPGITIITWTIQGAGGDQQECTISIYVISSSTAVCQNATVELGEDGLISLEPSDVNNGSSDCDNYTLQVSPEQFSCDDIGDQVVTLTLSETGNILSSCTATVTITDPNANCCAPPVALCQDITTQLNQDGNVSFGFFDINNGSIIDCILAGSEITNTSLKCADIGPNIVSMILTDTNGDISSCTATVTVEDNIKPTISCPTDFTQNNDPALCGATVSIPGPLTYADNCAVSFLKARVRPILDGVAGSWSSFQDDPSGYYEAGEYEVQWRAKDASNNKKNCKFNFEVVDAEVPNAVCLHPTITFNGESGIDLLGNDLFDAFASSDNCSAVSLVDFDKLFVICEEVGSMETVTVTVQDEAGNTAQCTSNVTVSGLPCGWDGEPGGIDCTGGSQPTYDPNTSTYTLTGEGCHSPGYYSNSDSQAFMSTELCGDGEIIAEVTQVTGDGFAGIGMREDLSPGAKMFQLGIDGVLLTKREMRMTTEALAFNHLFQTQGKNWLKLSRAGSTFTAEHSSDGINWSLVIVSNIPMSNCLEVGMYVENAAATGAATGVFENVQINTISALVASDQGSTRQDVASSLKHATSIFVYPNPARELINIGLEGFADQAITITIYDKLGKAMKTVQKADYSNLENIQVNDLPGGAYFVEVQSSSYRHVQRLVLIAD